MKQPMRLTAWLTAGGLALACPSYAAASTYVLGDSLGEGVSMASGVKGFAHIGIRIRGPKALEQIRETPPGSTAFIFLGTNDAVGTVGNIAKSIDDVLAAAEQRHLKVIWAGPPCVRKAWDVHARELDDILRERLASTSAKYVSMRDARICSGTFQASDGVHMSKKGYRYMWEKVRGAVTTAMADVPDAKAAPADVPISKDRRRRRSADKLEAAKPSGSTKPAAAAMAAARAEPQPGPRVVMEVHVPTAPTEPLTWAKSGDIHAMARGDE